MQQCVYFNYQKKSLIEYEFGEEQRFKIQSDLFYKIMKRIKTKIINLEFKDQKINY